MDFRCGEGSANAMAGRRWTQEELQKLDDMSGTYSVPAIARKLGRTYHSVNLKLSRTGRTGFYGSTDMLAINQVHKILGVESRKIKRWQENGLKILRKGKYCMIHQEDLLRHLKEHPKEWNAAHVTDDAIFVGAAWFMEKRQQDVPKRYFWTEQEESKLRTLYYMDIPISEIARRMGRSESSIKYKLYTGGILNGRTENPDC